MNGRKNEEKSFDELWSGWETTQEILGMSGTELAEHLLELPKGYIDTLRTYEKWADVVVLVNAKELDYSTRAERMSFMQNEIDKGLEKRKNEKVEVHEALVRALEEDKEGE